MKNYREFIIAFDKDTQISNVVVSSGNGKHNETVKVVEIAALEQAEAKISILEVMVDHGTKNIEQLQVEKKDLEADAQMLVEALKYYANEKNWYPIRSPGEQGFLMKMVIGSIDTEGIDWVGGYSARKTITEWNKKRGGV